jgi:hypothetical protein
MKDFLKKFIINRQFLFIFFTNFLVMGLLFSFPLRALCNLTGVHIGYLIFLSGLLSYIVAKVNQNIKLKANDINLVEFTYLFSLGMAITSFFIIFGYPLLGLFISGEIGIVVEMVKKKFLFFLNYLYSDLQPETLNTGVKDTARTNSLQSDSHIEGNSNSNSEIIPMINKGLKEQIEDWIKSDVAVITTLDKLGAMPLTLGSKEIPGQLTFFNVLDYQAKYLHHHVIKRKVWFQLFTDNIINSANDKLAFERLNSKLNDLFDDYFIEVEKLSSKTDVEVALKEFFNRTNGVRNAAYKELNAFEKNLDAKLKTEFIYANKEFKHIYNIEYPAVKKRYVDKDSYLRKKVSEVLNAPKQRN